MTGQRKDINFIASYHREKAVDRLRLRRRAAYIAPLAGICVVLLAVFAVLQIALAGKNQQLDQLEGYIDRHMPAYEEAMALTAQRDALAQAADALQASAQGQAAYPTLDQELFGKVAACTDADFTIQSYRYDGVTLQLGAKAASAEVMPQAVQKLRDTGLFYAIDYTGYNSAADGSYTCTIGCALYAAQD